MKKLLLASCLTLAAFSVFAQEGEEEYELRGSEKYGYVIDKDGNKIEGIVRLVAGPDNPWMNQKKVRFIDKASIDPSRKRQKFKKLDAGDIKEYVAIEENGTERHFRRIKYTNTREGLSNGGGLGGSIKTIKNFSSTTHLAEVLVDGKISMFRLYGYPSPVAAGEKDVAEAKKAEEDLRDNPDVLYQKEDGKVRELAVSDFKELVSDCKVVKEKLAAYGYPSYDPAVQEKKKSGMGKLIKGEMDRAGFKLENMGTEILTDYNATCKD